MKTKEYDGKLRNVYPLICAVCSNTFYSPKHRARKYCSQKCAGIARRTSVETKCGQCGVLTYKSKSKIAAGLHKVSFCTRACKDKAQSVDGNCPEIRPGHYIDGKFRYRNRAMKHYGAKCNRCGYCELKQMLDVHHKDSDRDHSEIENLEVLCVWCHALITRGLLV